MTEYKPSTSIGKIPKVLSFRRSPSLPTLPGIPHIGGHTAHNHDQLQRKTKSGKKVSPYMISSLKNSLRSLGKKKKERQLKPLMASTTSSITCTDFDRDLSGFMNFELDDDEEDDDGAIPLPISLQRGVSLDSDAKPLRPLRRGSSIETDYFKGDYKDPSKTLDLSNSDPSSVSFSGLFGDESPPPPPFARAVSLDSDCKPLKPLRRGSNFSAQLGYNSIEYPEPGKRVEARDNRPHFPNRKSSMDVSVSQSSTDTPGSGVPSRTNIGSIPHVKRRMVDRQPCVPGRKASLSHRSMLLDSDDESAEMDTMHQTKIAGVTTPSA